VPGPPSGHKRWRYNELAASIRTNKTISEPVRQGALHLLGSSWQRAVRQQASRLVDSLFHKPLLKPDVIEAIEKDTTLRPEIRHEALASAQRSVEDPARLNSRSEFVVRFPNAQAKDYRPALRQAEAACRIEPENGLYLSTLGVAHYRMGDYNQALIALTRSDALYAKQYCQSRPADLAFLAMAQHRLGRADEARKLLDRLRQSLQAAPWKTDSTAQAFLREAEDLILAPSRKGSEK
jgi:tetratricopeptide (TPR) repeat protein